MQPVERTEVEWREEREESGGRRERRGEGVTQLGVVYS